MSAKRFFQLLFLAVAAVLALAVGFLLAQDRQTGLADLPEKLSGVTSPTYTLLFTGDIMLDRSVRKQIEANQDPLYPFLRIAKTLRDADLAIANLEGPISANGTRSGSQYSFRFEPVGTINSLTDAGLDVLSLANNHILDYGPLALIDTLKYLSANGISSVGAGQNVIEANTPVFKTLGETTIAFFSYTTLYPESLWADSENPGISSFDLNAVQEKIAAVRAQKKADLVAVLLHWGEEYQTSANEDQRKIAQALIDAGADLIIGHHPHVVQEVETYTSSVRHPERSEGSIDPSSTDRWTQDDKHVGYIAYSLGNFVFDQDFSAETMEGLMLRAYVKNKKIERIEQIPIKLTPTFQPYIMNDEKQ